MIKNAFKYIFLGVIFIMLFYGIILVYTYQHEKAHFQVAKGHGCLNGSIAVKLDGSGRFICLNYNNRSNEYIIQERQLHGLNEIIGYNVNFIVISILVVGLLFIYLYVIFNLETLALRRLVKFNKKLFEKKK